MVDQRGVIKNRERARQIIDYGGIIYKKITPTDIDGFLEFSNVLFIFFELKLRGTPVLHGQRLALQRLASCCNAGEKTGVAIVADHDVHDTEQDIYAAECDVREYWWDERWMNPREKITLKKAVGRLYGRYVLKNGPM